MSTAFLLFDVNRRRLSAVTSEMHSSVFRFKPSNACRLFLYTFFRNNQRWKSGVDRSGDRGGHKIREVMRPRNSTLSVRTLAAQYKRAERATDLLGFGRAAEFVPPAAQLQLSRMAMKSNPGGSKLGRWKLGRSKGRKTIFNVYKFRKMKTAKGRIKHPHERVTWACAVLHSRMWGTVVEAGKKGNNQEWFLITSRIQTTQQTWPILINLTYGEWHSFF
jgi:hypothetical protein